MMVSCTAALYYVLSAYVYPKREITRQRSTNSFLMQKCANVLLLYTYDIRKAGSQTDGGNTDTKKPGGAGIRKDITSHLDTYKLRKDMTTSHVWGSPMLNY